MEMIELAEHPQLAKLVKLAGSKKRRAILHRNVKEVRLSMTYWSEGSRYTYYRVDLPTGKLTELPHYAPPQFGGPAEEPGLQLDANTAVIRTGVFVGKPATPAVFLPN